MLLNFDVEKVQRAKMRSSARNQMSMIAEDQHKPVRGLPVDYEDIPQALRDTLDESTWDGRYMWAYPEKLNEYYAFLFLWGCQRVSKDQPWIYGQTKDNLYTVASGGRLEVMEAIYYSQSI